MKVKIKKLVPEVVTPMYGKPGDAGMDLTATSKSYDECGNVVYGTSLAIEIPEGYLGLLLPRSSISTRTLSLSNAIGLVDSGFRGEITCKFKPTMNHPSRKNGLPREYEVGERICQLVILPYPSIEFEEVVELSTTERGVGGYGSTGL